MALLWSGSADLASGIARNPFPNRVAAGDVSSGAAVLWAHATALGSARFILSTNADFSSTVTEAGVEVVDEMLPVKVEVGNLSPGTVYYYRVVDQNGNFDSGRFRTPRSNGALEGLRFGVSGDWRGELAPYPSVANVPQRDLEFFVELGDTIYADYSSPDVPLAQAITLADFRAKHNEVYSSRLGLNAIADLRATTAIFAVHDDHEVINNFAGGAAPSTDPRFDTNGVFINESLLYRTALQAFHEFNPIRTLIYDTPLEARTHLKPKLYRSQTYGSDAAIFLLDARSFRDTELAGVTNPLDTAGAKAFDARSFDLDPISGAALPQRTMLGRAQFESLKADLLSARNGQILWKFVLIGEPIQSLGFSDGPDRFEGYAAERTELLRFIADNQIGNVVFISADIHGTVVNNVSYQIGPDQPFIPTGTFEVVTGPVAYDKPLGPTAFDVAATIQILPGLNLLKGLLNYVGLPNRAAFDSLPISDKDRLFKSIMDVQLTTIGLDATGLEGSDINAQLLEGGYVAVHTYGWTEFEIDRDSHWLTVTTYGIPAYAPDQVNSGILASIPQVVSRFVVQPRAELPGYPSLGIVRDGPEVRVTWNAARSNLVLQTKGSASPVGWAEVTNSIDNSLGLNSIHVPATGGGQLFRLGQHQ